jgi:hypothetical protein
MLFQGFQEESSPRKFLKLQMNLIHTQLLVFTEELSLDQAKKGVLAGGLRQICYKI